MVKKLLFGPVLVGVFIGSFLFFLPKANLYYFVEKMLQKEHIVVDNEEIRPKGFSLEIEHADVYVEGIPAAKVMEISIKPYLLLNTVHADFIRLGKAAKGVLPRKIDSFEARYGVFDPMHIVFEAKGEFGTAEGVVDLKERRLHVSLRASETMRRSYGSLLRMMRKTKEGEYTYEQSF